jgi:hypothetical protein
MLTNTIKKVILALLFVFSANAEQSCDLFNRVIVTGASVTSGFGVTTPPIEDDLGAYPVNMKHIMEGVITSDHEEVKFLGNLLFFKNSRANATAYIEKIKGYKPTLVIGIDFLFWFGHGTPPEGNDVATYRMEKLNFALDLLDQLSVRMVIGNLPNVRNAVGRMLSASQVPTEKTLQELNERIFTWCKSHENVTIIDVHGLWNKALQDEEIVLFEHTWPAGSQEKLLQKDMLHTTFEGTVAASLLVIEAIDVDCVETNPKVIMQKAASSARKEAKLKE